MFSVNCHICRLKPSVDHCNNAGASRFEVDKIEILNLACFKLAWLLGTSEDSSVAQAIHRFKNTMQKSHLNLITL